MIERQQLVDYLDQLLDSGRIKDYCPNGLQVEGKAQIQTVVTGVTASMALLEQAAALNADAILVHHGYFWKNEAPMVVGMKKRRLQLLLAHDINLLGYHLPLDVHPTLGNNAQLAQILHLETATPVLGVEPLGVLQQGKLAKATPLTEIAALLAEQLQRDLLVEDVGIGAVTKLAWCSGGGQGYIEQAAAAGAQLFISGEVSEQTIHCARELGIHFIAAGHHATERYGVKALGEHLASELGLTVHFVDIANPA
ncbi:Nif3-like dinuclear metal center hexameric protein [Alishewanella sp. SMS8]|uniref:Nif3-like dinuclear metal center hexameric protein n=1 Tax=unclassified Alishewanella TaxID=2628974 RepID=UPI0027422687|nr:Nif3-like dinuclear metal center hexameric protein [Alishewanella sp. SMS8]MDP4945368.1 Nif3-like dinuclear metal center hexameric protein [Alishewanella sp.]MDP5207221.1 Nif3-like dinuclear metal center hexameric protein [Alishewanella sp. SMS9]MDP5036679.1 Nif3-like dinuclear metal center hexameric protein [Alishewanella sp.]MDP5188147.1 Nif3-like dinuclear metal center hexameric protein [Alishewanella sp.]MDP5457981.1 Nif3-like dinuclear metal center hexameric protein [Alishewanella sp. 